MKKKLKVILPFIIVFALAAVILIAIICKNSAEKRLYSSYYSLNDDFIIECENGSFGKKENSSEYIKTALQSNANAIEVDLCFDKNGKPFIEEENEKINDKTVSLEKLVEFMVSDTSYDRFFLCLHLEKEASNLAEVDKICERYNFTNRIYYTGISLNQAQYVRNQSKIPFYLSIDIKDYKSDKDMIKFFSLVSNSMAKGIICDIDEMNENIYDTLHENFIEITFDGIDKKSDFIKAAKYSPSRIKTENAYEIYDILRKWQSNAPVEYYGN